MPGNGTTATPAATSARRLTRRRQWRTTASISRVVAGTTAHSVAGRCRAKNLPSAEVAIVSLCRCASRGSRSGERLRPDLLEPLDAHRLRGPQLLREQADAQLLEPPAEFVEARVARAAPLGELPSGSAARAGAARPGARVARRIGAQLVEPQRRSPSGSAAGARAAPTACRRRSAWAPGARAAARCRRRPPSAGARPSACAAPRVYSASTTPASCARPRCAISVSRPRPSSMRRANAAASVGSGSARKARSSATSTICSRSSSGRAERQVGHRHLLQVGHVLLERTSARRGSAARPAGAGRRDAWRAATLGLVEDLDLDVRALVDQRREADQRLAALAQLHQLGQLAEGPGGVAPRRRRRCGAPATPGRASRASATAARRCARVRRGRAGVAGAASAACVGKLNAASAWNAERACPPSSAFSAARLRDCRAGGRARRRRAGSSAGAAAAARA